MDNIFKKYDFCHVYVDDILITSDNIVQHSIHLNTFAGLCLKHRLALSEKRQRYAYQK